MDDKLCLRVVVLATQLGTSVQKKGNLRAISWPHSAAGEKRQREKQRAIMYFIRWLVPFALRKGEACIPYSHYGSNLSLRFHSQSDILPVRQLLGAYLTPAIFPLERCIIKKLSATAGIVQNGTLVYEQQGQKVTATVGTLS
jgi:hypothetical protein